MSRLTRRGFLATLGAIPLGAMPRGAARAARAKPIAADATVPSTAAVAMAVRTVYVFFAAAEARFIEAACERLIPAAAHAPGALMAAVPQYLDRQLAGPWGSGDLPYRAGSWQPGTAVAASAVTGGSPARFFRAALGEIMAQFATRGAAFEDLPPASQAAYLVTLEAGVSGLARAHSSAFFDLLLGMTVEGFFSHPQYGNSRDRLPWRMRGYPGAHAGAS